MFVTDTFDNGSYKTLKIESEAVSMRIDAYNAVSQIYKTSSYSKNNKAVTNKKENDKYEISDTAKLWLLHQMSEWIWLMMLRHVFRPEHII